MSSRDLYEKMISCGMISDDRRHLLALLADELSGIEDADEYLKLFTLYFSLIEDGNVYMSLEAEELRQKTAAKMNGLKVRFQENGSDRNTCFDDVQKELENAFGYLGGMHSLPALGEDKLFLIDDRKRLFTRKYFNAKNGIREAAKKLFTDNEPRAGAFDYTMACVPAFRLSDGQREVLEKGFYNNLLVTGGPGTGKTTSILFLLLSLLESTPEYGIYLTAPSGKAAARMKESILSSLANLSKDYMEGNSAIIKKIVESEDYTIHRLLGFERDSHGFKFNKDHLFAANSIFVIDEASMIDISLFASLLEAIPEKARIFILGDKNQLPSVECGAVFGEWLGELSAGNKVELTESKRFEKDSTIYCLAEAVNKGTVLPVSEKDWQALKDFVIAESEFTPEKKRNNRVFYYDGVKDFKAEALDKAILDWYDHYYGALKECCTDLDKDNTSALNEIGNIVESARILCADNESVRGVNHINNRILKKRYEKKGIKSTYYPGELIMITKNNNALGLYNGDSGVIVTFKDDDTLYAMFRKSPKDPNISEGLSENSLSKIGGYLFYPMRLISRDEVTPAFAITIHKSQGSDYDDILILLPKLKGHPLLTRQIVYTAITRTKGNTYLVSCQDNLDYAKNAVIIRDTGVFPH